MRPIIRPVASMDELADAFGVIGAQLLQRLTHKDRRLADLAARFPEDRSLMLVVEDGGCLVGGALAFRRAPRAATLRIIGLDPGVRGTGLGRRLVERIEEEAARLGVDTISLGADEAIGFYTHLGYAEAGGAWHKRVGPALPFGSHPNR
jgi:GNAT superfamily N-acetyltransferase